MRGILFLFKQVGIVFKINKWVKFLLYDRVFILSYTMGIILYNIKGYFQVDVGFVFYHGVWVLFSCQQWG